MPTTGPHSLDPSKSTPSQNADVYEIRIRGILDDHWQPWFEGMILKADAQYDGGQGCTVITGPLADQPALHGVLERIRDLNLTLISVRRLSEEPTATGDTAEALLREENGSETP